MNGFLRQATASQARCTPSFWDDTDFKTAETGLTIANTDVKLSINGAASQNKNSGGGTHIANGSYSLTFDATDTATVGELYVTIKVAGATGVFMCLHVLEEAVYDALFAASAAGYQVPIWAAASSTVNLSGTTVKTATDVETDTQDIQSKIGTPAGASVSADIAAVQADLPQRITKNTALAKFPIYMVDSTDHITPETGLTITATRSLDGGAFGACANAVTEIGTGHYYIDLAAGDLNGNCVILKFTATGADTRIVQIVTQPT